VEGDLSRAVHRSSARLALFAAALAAGVAAPAAVRAAPTRFVHAHPVAARAGGGYCYVDAPHLHSYAPDHAALYQPTPAGYYFIGDPTPFGYDGERHVYYGHHPVAAAAAPPFCFIDGPHYHAAAPPRGDDYTVVDGIPFYTGPRPAAYVAGRARRWKEVNDELLPFARFRPAVHVVVPPPEWRGSLYRAPGTKLQLPQRPKQARHTRVRVEIHD